MSMKVVGTKDVIAALNKALVKWEEKDVRKIVSKGAQIIVAEAKVRAPMSRQEHYYTNEAGQKVTFMPGNLRESIRILPKFSGDPKGVYVGPKTVRKGASGSYGSGSRVNAYYAHFIEYGTRSHSIAYKGEHVSGTNGAVVSGIRAQPFMRPAYDSKAEQASIAIIDETVKFIERKVPNA